MKGIYVFRCRCNNYIEGVIVETKERVDTLLKYKLLINFDKSGVGTAVSMNLITDDEKIVDNFENKIGSSYLNPFNKFLDYSVESQRFPWMDWSFGGHVRVRDLIDELIPDELIPDMDEPDFDLNELTCSIYEKIN